MQFSLESCDKVTRAERLSSQINAGNVVMVRGPWNKAFTDECWPFPFGTYEDQIDAAARAFNGLMHPQAGIFA